VPGRRKLALLASAAASTALAARPASAARGYRHDLPELAFEAISGPPP
jgi:hypothetical protein